MTVAMEHPTVQAQRILVVDDEKPMRFLITELLRKEGYETAEATHGREAVERVQAEDFDVVILDQTMPVQNGIATLPEILALKPEMIVLMVTANDSKDLALDAIKLGAHDYFTKPFDAAEMRVVLRRALELRRLRQQVRDLSRQVRHRYSFENIIGSSSAMREVYDVIERVAGSQITALIYGASGTGKELVAHAIHARSPRKDKPFVAMNCASIPESLLESELFGYEKGAFTGATARRAGKFELAQGGTLFLDEIGDMDLNLQAKILRVLQEREIARIGGSAPIRVDVRILAATNKDLCKAVAAGEFREDLFFRLNVVPVYLPPLRERTADIPLLVEHFLKRASEAASREIRGVSQEVMQAFAEYHWPGNVRELENVIHRAVVLARGDIISRDDLPLEMRSEKRSLGLVDPHRHAPPAAPEAPQLDEEDDLEDEDLVGGNGALLDHTRKLREEAEKEIILKSLDEHRWRRGVTADALGISRRSLLRKMKKYCIEG